MTLSIGGEVCIMHPIEPCTPNRKDLTMKYQCDLCGYVYDPAVGDPDNGIEPGTSFDDLPDDWVCPECGATKDDFSPAE